METRATTNPLGVRGIGEGGTIPAAATIVNAVARTIDPKKTGHEFVLFVSAFKAGARFRGLPGGRHRLNAIVFG